MKTKFFYVIILSFIFLGLKSYAVPYPERIKWQASPEAFVTSLYQGVLGRSPENRNVVTSWASSLHTRRFTRLQLFWRFISSPEYQRSRWAKQRREYSIYYKYVGTYRNKKSYYITKSNVTGGHYVKGRYTFGIAMALMYYQIASDPQARRHSSSNEIRLLGITPK